ncbi:MAG: alpha/beta fold hydrolase [Acidimicrobiia bacterium]
MSQRPHRDSASSEAGGADQRHTASVVAAHEQALLGSGFHSRFVEVISGERVHVMEGKEGTPLVMLHGSGPSALLLLPLMKRLTGVRAIAVDRPGFGLSDPHKWPSTNRRDAAVEWVDCLYDSLGLEEASLLGSSAGGTWGIWFALAHPQKVTRMILLGAPPTLSVNSPPAPLRGIAEIDPANPPPMPLPSRETVIESMSGMGEGKTIVSYPDQIEALIAAGQDPVASMANLDELQSLITPNGWEPSVETQVNELERLQSPTLLVWGLNDPLGGKDAAHHAASAIPDAQLEMLDAGHGPWLGHPDQVANLVSSFILGPATK